MSIFGTIMSKIFGSAQADSAPSSDATAPSGPSKGNETPTPPAAQQPASGAAPSTAPSSIDVAQVLDGMEAKGGQKLDWRRSIVDLMKLVGMDSSLSARKELAGELHYTGDTNDSATMNMWLHKEVMKKARREWRQAAAGPALIPPCSGTARPHAALDAQRRSAARRRDIAASVLDHPIGWKQIPLAPIYAAVHKCSLPTAKG